MAHKLNHPTEHEQRGGDAHDDARVIEPCVQIHGDQIAEKKQEHQHRRAERAIKDQIINSRHGDGNQRDIDAKDRPRHQCQHHRKNNHRHTDEMGGDIATVAMIGRVLGDLLFEVAHGGYRGLNSDEMHFIRHVVASCSKMRRSNIGAAFSAFIAQTPRQC